MTVTLNLDPEVEARLSQEAVTRGLSIEDYIIKQILFTVSD
jgi:predicted HicB family RNase H-like nuclease